MLEAPDIRGELFGASPEQRILGEGREARLQTVSVAAGLLDADHSIV